MADKLAFFLKATSTGATYTVQSPFGPESATKFNKGVTLSIPTPSTFSLLAVCPGKLYFNWRGSDYSVRLEPSPGARIPVNTFDNVSAFVFEGVTDIDDSFLTTVFERSTRDQNQAFAKFKESLGHDPRQEEFKDWIVQQGLTHIEVLRHEVSIPVAMPSNKVTFIIETSKPIGTFFGETNICDPASFWSIALSQNLVIDQDLALVQTFVQAVPKKLVIDIRDEYNRPITRPPSIAGPSLDCPYAGDIVLGGSGVGPLRGTDLIRGVGVFDVGAVTPIEISSRDSNGQLLDTPDTQILFWDSMTLQSDTSLKTITLPDQHFHLVVRALRPSDWFAQQSATPSAGFSNPARCTLGNIVTPFIDGEDYFRDLNNEIHAINPNVPSHYFHLLCWWVDPLKTYLLEGDQNSNLMWALSHLSETSPAKTRAIVYDHPFWDLMHPEGGTLDWTAILNVLGARFVRDDEGLPSAFPPALPGTEGDHHIKIVSIENDQGKISYCGGIDIAPNRMTDSNHEDASIGNNFLPDKIHDIQLKVEGPASYELERVFRNRWMSHPSTTPKDIADPVIPAETFPGIVTQVACTIPRNEGYTFAPQGDTTLFDTTRKAILNAHEYIYIEDQYFAHEEIAKLIHSKLADIQFVILVGPGPYGMNNLLFNTIPGGMQWRTYIEGFINPLGAITADVQRRVVNSVLWSVFHSSEDISFERFTEIITQHPDASDKLRVCYLENDSGEYIYPHSKLIIIDDVFVSCGSANIDARGMGNILKSDASREHASSTECNLMCIDTSVAHNGRRIFARDLRARLWSEHLEIPFEEMRATPPISSYEEYWKAGRGRVRLFGD